MLSSSNVPDVPGASNTRSFKYQGFGGFPGPANLLSQVIKIMAPQTYRKVERTMTIQTVTTLKSSSVPWLNFNDLVVGRNSYFRTDSLTDEQLEDIGGAEYKALRLLSYLVPAVRMFIFIQYLGCAEYGLPSTLLAVTLLLFCCFCLGYLLRNLMTGCLPLNLN